MTRKKKYILIFLLMPFFHPCNGQSKSKGKFKKASTRDIISSKKQSADTTLILLTYGLPYFDRQNSENVICRKWGIRFYPVAGCVVTEDLVDSVKTNNEKINKLIERKYGTNWRDRFEKEVDEEFEKEKIVTQILDKVDFIKKKDDQMDLEGNGLHYNMTPIENSSDYNVSVEGWGKIDNKDIWVSYYRMTVNYKTEKYKLLDSKIEKRE